MKQLSIFDVFGEPFDKRKAVFNKEHGHLRVCEVLAYIPKDALLPGEQKSYVFGKRDERWVKYVTAIFIQGFDWCSALKVFENTRNEGEPIKLLIYDGTLGFEPEMVIEYRN